MSAIESTKRNYEATSFMLVENMSEITVSITKH